MLTPQQIADAHVFAKFGAEECERDAAFYDENNPDFPMASAVSRDRAVKFRACLAAVDAYERVVALLASKEPEQLDILLYITPNELRRALDEAEGLFFPVVPEGSLPEVKAVVRDDGSAELYPNRKNRGI